jgi:aminopeptidase N
MKTLFISLFLILTQNFAHAQTSVKERVNEDNLTREFAELRKSQIRSVDYDLSFKFAKGREDFDGKALLKIELLKLDKTLSVDFIGKRIRSIKVNGSNITQYKARKGSFDLPANILTSQMQVEVDYVGEFNKEGMSFQRVVDPEDKSEYLFSDFEPYYAHGLFPCFDQPDLKAHFNLVVEGPKDWTVISNALESSKQATGETTTTHFHQSVLISPYLFFLGTGPFVEFKDQLGQLPLYIFTRKSLAKYMDAENIFKTVKRGLQFYNEYFSFQYPFPKFGLVYIPEFNWGGMENPGAIALNEKGIYRGKVTQSDRDHRDSLILHEMAHMWFGDLVTMQWWSDLWLNESFATYAAALAQERGFHFSGTWQNFFSEKIWGYWQDQLVTTHSIETEVADTRTAKSNFDGITYAKGGAALKQLNFFVGDEGFQKGIRQYFQKYQFKNAIRENFISEISQASQKDLKKWTQEWLQTAGPNRVHAKWSCQQNKISQFAILQEPSISQTLSSHRTRIGLFSTHKGFSLSSKTDVNYNKAVNELQDLVGKPCPQFVFPNLDDQDYALFSLDEISLAETKAALTQNPDPLLRLMIWNTLGQMVQDSKLKVSEYFDKIFFALETENDDSLLSIVLSRHGDIKDFYFQYLTLQQRAALAPRLEQLIWKRVLSSDEGSSRQLLFYEFYVSVAQSEEGLKRLHALLDETHAIAAPVGLKMDQDRRWDIISRLAFIGYYSRPLAFEKLRTLIASEAKRDPSATGQRNAYVALASLPELASKKLFWNEIKRPEKIAPSSLAQATNRFYSPNSPQLTEFFVNDYFKRVTAMNWTTNDSYVEMYFTGLFPSEMCSKALLNLSEAKLRKAKNLTSIARRSWLEANDELARCIRVRSFEMAR